MPVLPIHVYGDKILRKKASKISEVDAQTVSDIKNMFDTMRNASGIGLAANQVGINKSLFVVDISPVEGYEKYKPMVFINPKILKRSEETVVIEEGCLSLPNLRSEVERPKNIVINFYDTEMKQQSMEADGLLARVIQHEYDHLQGVFFTDRLDGKLKKELKKELLKIKNREVEIDYKITHAEAVGIL